jgi:hypothetical protein
MRTNTRRAAVVGAGIVGVMGAGVAFAAWTTEGTGSGTATAGTDQALTVTVSPATGLSPTGTTDVPFTVTNPNSYAVTLSQATLQNVTVDKVGCVPGVVTGSPVTLSDRVPAGTTSTSKSFPVTMSNAATDECKNAVFTLTLKVTGASSS